MMENEKFKELAGYFNEAIVEITREMAGVTVKETDQLEIVTDRKYSVVIGIVGEIKGRTLIKLGEDLVTRITEQMNFGPLDNTADTSLYLGEYANILCGKAITTINNKYQSSELRLTPPAIFSGQEMRIITPKLNSIFLYYSSEFGSAIMDVGFEGRR